MLRCRGERQPLPPLETLPAADVELDELAPALLEELPAPEPPATQ